MFFKKKKPPEDFKNLSNEKILNHLKIVEQSQKKKYKGDYHHELLVEVLSRDLIPFYFVFHDENTQIEYLMPLLCKSIDFEKWFEDDISNVGFVSDLEGMYGVHDIYGVINSKEDIFGFTSYEVEENKMKDLLRDWKQKFIENGWITGHENWIERKTT